MNEKITQYLVFVATVSVICVNYLAATGVVNNKTTGELSQKFTTEITPSGYAFAIWSLIYFGLFVFSIYQNLPSQKDNKLLRKLRTVYILNCIANSAWIFAWHYELIPLSLIIMLVILGTLIYINLKVIETDTIVETITTKIPFNIYFGWITVATILNASITLVYFGVKMTSTSTSIIGAILILIATTIGILLRFKISSAFYPITIAWGITAIAVKQSGDTIVVVTAAIGVILLLIAALSGFIKQDK
jgi:hypothetical protein